MHLRWTLLASLLALLWLAACTTPPEAGLGLAVSPETLTLARGSSDTLTVTVNRSGGFEDDVAVTLSGAPAGVTAEPLTIAGSETSGTLTITASDTAALGTTTVTVEGAGTGVEASDTSSLTVTQAPGTQEEVATGFNGPMGSLVDNEGNIWVIDSGTGGDIEVAPGVTYGDTSRIVRVAPDGTQTVVATLPSLATPEGAAGGSRLAMVDGTLYATSAEYLGDPATEPPFFVGVVEVDGETVTGVGNTWAFEASENPDGLPNTAEIDGIHSHPYGLTGGPDGALYVADAGGNDLVRIDPDTGEVSLVAVFDQITIPTPDGEQVLQAVPTGVTLGEDDNLYVTFFHGGVAQVTTSGEVTPYAQDVILATDIQLGPDGELYVVQIADFEFTPGSGTIIRVQPDGSEMVVEGLMYPSSISFDDAGDAYVTTNTLGEPGSGSLVKISGLTQLETTE